MGVNFRRATWTGYIVAGLVCGLPCCGCGQPSGPPTPTSDSTIRVDAGSDLHVSPHGSGPTVEAPVVPAGDGQIDLGSIRLTAAKSWQRREPRMAGFILAEFALPKAPGDSDDGRLTVSSAQGGVQGNITRWRKQFGDKPEKESTEKINVSGATITLVDFSGTFLDQRGGMMMGGETVERPGYRMLGAIIDLGQEQLYFVKAYGPAKTIAAHADEFRAMLGSLKKA
jgi:hypothetical protein